MLGCGGGGSESGSRALLCLNMMVVGLEFVLHGVN